MTLPQITDQLFDSLSEDLILLNQAGVIPVTKLCGVLSSVQTILDGLKTQVMNNSIPDSAGEISFLNYIPPELISAPHFPKTDLTQLDAFYFNTLSTLVQISDLLYDFYQKTTPDVSAIIELLNAVKQVIPCDIRPTLKLPKALIHYKKEPIAEDWKTQLTHSVLSRISF